MCKLKKLLPWELFLKFWAMRTAMSRSRLRLVCGKTVVLIKQFNLHFSSQFCPLLVSRMTCFFWTASSQQEGGGHLLTFWSILDDFCNLSTTSTWSSGPVLVKISTGQLCEWANSHSHSFDYASSEPTLVETPVTAPCWSFSLRTLVPGFQPERSGWSCFSFLFQFPGA